MPGFPGRRFQVLALLDGTHAPLPESRNLSPPQGWRSVDVARVCGIAGSSAHHLLVRLKGWDLVQARQPGAAVEIRRKMGRSKTLVGSIPDRTIFWEATQKGKDRVAYKGGHAKWCPMCAEAQR